MLKRRLIPKLQLKSSKIFSRARMVLVTTCQFSKVIEIGDPISQAKIYEAQAADELIFVDLDATMENRVINSDLIKKAAEEIFMPFTCGGGVKSIEDFRILLSNGADKVSINTWAVRNPNLINEAASIYGSQCVVLSIDYRKDYDNKYYVWINGGKINTGLDPVEWAIEGERRGVGEVLLTSIDHDGMRNGLDLNLTRAVTERISIPVITSGGCGLTSHFIDGFIKGNVSAVSAGTYFCFKDENPMQTRSQIRNAGIPIRIHR